MDNVIRLLVSFSHYTSSGTQYSAFLIDKDTSKFLLTSKTPFVDASRVILDLGYDPSTILEMYDNDQSMVCLRGRLRDIAGIVVIEGERSGPRFGRYRPFEGTPIVA
jgi:hypothetical protein